MITSTSRPLDAGLFHRHARGHWSVKTSSTGTATPSDAKTTTRPTRATAPRNPAALRNMNLGVLALDGITKITETVESIGRNPMRALPPLTHRHA